MFWLQLGLIARTFSSLRRQQLQRDPIEICLHHRPWFVSHGRADDRQKCLLGQIFRAVFASQPALEEAIQRLAIAGKQLFKRFARSTLELQHERFIADHGHPRMSFSCRNFLLPRVLFLAFYILNVLSRTKVPKILSPGVYFFLKMHSRSRWQSRFPPPLLIPP